MDYFRQYLDWDTWEEIVTCNTGWPDFPTTVTAKEVAQFVGIHIAMGTLKVSNLQYCYIISKFLSKDFSVSSNFASAPYNM